MNRELLDLVLALDGDDGGAGALGDDGDAGLLGVLLGQVGEGLGDSGDVLGDVSQVVGVGVGGGLGLVADDVVPVRGGGVEGVLEELGDKRGREVDDEGLVLGGGLLGQGHDGGRADGEVVAADVVEVGRLREGPDLGAPQVLEVVVVRGAELGAERPVRARDDHAAPARRRLRVHAVLDPQPDLLHRVPQDRRVLVVAHAAEVHHAVRRQHVLRAARRVLRRPARDQLRVVVVQQLLVQRDVLLLRQDRVVRLQPVFRQQVIAAEGLDV